ncbi:MAG TPA: cupredoxin family copper-binding protein, partial [Chroococcales cyanobacterium]
SIWLASRNNSKNNTGSTNTTSMNMNSNSSNSSSSTPVATNKVTIQNFAFSPADITVKKGTAVTWTNGDSVTHTVTETDSQTGPNSGDLAPGKSYSFTFDTAGTYHYHCSIHTEMTGTVTVTE